MTTLSRWYPNGPGSFQAPAGITAVRDRTGTRWTRTTSGSARWTKTGTHWIRWRTLVDEHGPLTDDSPS